MGKESSWLGRLDKKENPIVKDHALIIPASSLMYKLLRKSNFNEVDFQVKNLK